MLIYRYQGDDLYLARMNTHSEVFK
ncbi:type II toxin-antitoxin system YafQ family toxin [Lonepinella koalarum]|nr:type II toxin-antitoxin system YafQ family toxin [Lonepinella koalarum]